MNIERAERPENQFRVYEPKMEWLNGEIAKLNKRAAKLGCAPIVITPTGEVEDQPIYSKEFDHKSNSFPIIGYRHFIWVALEGSAPKFAGWSLAAVVEHADEGNILRKSPECKVELAQFRSGAPRCDHCKALRNRKDTYIVIHESGDTKMIGSNCIKDFLGHANPALLVKDADFRFSAAEVLGESEDFEGYSGGVRNDRVPVGRLMAYACCAINHKGFVSGKAAYQAFLEGRSMASTKDTALSWMSPAEHWVVGKQYFVPTDADVTFAAAARQYVLDTLGTVDAESLNDFEHNLLVACKCEAVEKRNMGIIAFVPEYYSRAIEKKAFAEEQAKVAAESNYFGTVGERCKKVEIEYVKSTGWDSDFGYTYLHTFAGPNGARIMWKTGSDALDQVLPGTKFTADFTVKKHEDYKGVKQTAVLRLKYKAAAQPVAVAA